MPEYTTNYNLIKPLEEEYYNINQFNDNMDTIDTILKSTNDSLGNNYLPLSAGSSKKLTGNLYLNSDNPHYYLQYEGVNKGNISYNLDANYNIALYNNQGLSLRLYDNGDVTLNGNGNGSIKLRPNNSDTGQLTVSNTGRVDIAGDIYHNKGASESAEYFQYNGTTKGQIYTSGSTGDYPTIHIASINNGTIKSSVSLNSNAGYIVATGTDIYLRPVYNSTTYQVLLSHSGTHTINGNVTVTGEINRNATTYSASQAASKSLSSGNTKICGVTVSEAGKYIISAYTHMAMTGGGNAYINLYKATNNTNAICYDNHYVKAGSSYFMTTTWATFTAGQACSFYIEVTTACTIDNATLDLIKIA